MKVGLVLEGGSMRALYSAGIMDVMMDEDIKIDGIIGVSAGALFSPNYYSKQRGRALRYNQKYCKDWRFISIPSFLLTGNVVNKQFAFYDMTRIHDQFDNETFMKNNTGFWAVVTNVKTGQAEYLKIDNIVDELEVLRASSALPFFSKMVEVNGEYYLDGGISDSVPVLKAKELGFDKLIVVLTQPYDFRKQPFKSYMTKALELKYHKYPQLVRALNQRYLNYNQTVETIIDLENKGEMFVFRPNRILDIGTIERNPQHMQDIYDLGVEDANQQMKALKDYLAR